MGVINEKCASPLFKFTILVIVLFSFTLQVLLCHWDDSMISLFLSGDEADKGPAGCVFHVGYRGYSWS